MRAFSKIGAAVALTLVASSATFAADVTVGADNILRVGGATATDRSLARGWLKDLCDAAATPSGGIEVFTTHTEFLGAGTTRNYAIACRTATTANGGVAGAAVKDVVMVKYSGGSSTGVTPVASGAVIPASGSANWVDFVACKGAVAGVAVPAAGGLPAYTLRTGCAAAGSQQAKAGVSDLEPALIVTGGGSLALSTLPGASVPFGVAVSRNLFEALQTAQGLVGCTGTVASYTPSCTPSLNSAQLRGIFKGNLLTVNRLEDANGLAIPNAPGVNGALIRICRRGDGSGTQRSFQVNFLGQGCGSQHSFVSPDNALAGTAYTIGQTERVFAGTGATDVISCLDDSNTQGRYAIGLLSLESTTFNDSDEEWRFVKLDGVFPSLENVVKAEYSFFTESACNRPNSGANPLSTIQSALASGTSTAAGIATGLCGSLRGETVQVSPGGFPWLLGTLNTPTTQNSWGDPTPATGTTTADVVANPTNSQTHASSYGASPRNCNPAWSSAVQTVGADDLDQP